MIIFIPARKGSKRLPNKNMKEFIGIPLIERTIIQALNITGISKVYVSTDDKNIIDLCKKYKEVSVDKRPSKLAKDETNIIEVLRYFCKKYKIKEEIIMLQTTSPLRETYDIHNCIRLKNYGYDIVTTARKSGLIDFKLNGAVYIFNPLHLENKTLLSGRIGLHIMPEERSIDIDTIKDFKKAENIIKEVDK